MNGALEAALARAGLNVRVELRDRVVVLIPQSGDSIATDAHRRDVVALVAEHGFTHVALELVD